MAQIKYYIEPSAFDRGFSKAVEHFAEWNTVLIDLGAYADVPEKHGCYSLRDGHVEASKEYLGQCHEITLENFKELTEGYEVNREYIIPGEVVTVILNELADGEATHIEVYDMLPNEVNIDFELDYKLILDESDMEKVAVIGGYATFEALELIVGLGNAIIMPKDELDKIVGHDVDDGIVPDLGVGSETDFVEHDYTLED